MTPEPQLTDAEEHEYRREQADYDSHLTTPDDEPEDEQEGDDQ